jgi:hypothetical protein
MHCIIPFRDHYPDLKERTRAEESLKYSLRSLELHGPEITNLIIVTDKLPAWISRAAVTYVPYADNPDSRFWERNRHYKLLAAFAQIECGPFLYMHDDHFLLPTYDATKNYFSHLWGGNETYQRAVANTKLIAGMPGQVFNYDVHCPMIMDVEKYSDTVKKLDWRKSFGYCIKTAYAYMNNITPAHYSDLKIDIALDYLGVRGMIGSGRQWFSASPRAWEGQLEFVLDELYPSKSKYEL